MARLTNKHTLPWVMLYSWMYLWRP